MDFTVEEIQEIEKALSFIIHRWHHNLAEAVLSIAKSKGVKDLYWNSSETLDAGGVNDGKVKYFYESFPSQLGFKTVNVDLRGKGKERLWHMDMGVKKHASDGLIELSQIPKGLQGAIIGILRGRGPYTKEDLRKAYGIIKGGREKKPKATKSFSYDYSKKWNGGQQFSKQEEIIVKQRLDKSTFDSILQHSTPSVQKFLSFIIDPSQHFDADVIGWALVSPINEDTWVVNQIQTDTINKYLQIKSEVMKGQSFDDKTLSQEEISHRLHGSNKSSWVQFMENNEELFLALQGDIRKIDRLPTDDLVDGFGIVTDWIRGNKDEYDRIVSAHNITKFKKNSFNLKRSKR
jgi:hypothetical protein